MNESQRDPTASETTCSAARSGLITILKREKNGGGAAPYLFCGEQGLVRYWHIGNSRNANAMVARTGQRGRKQSSESWERGPSLRSSPSMGGACGARSPAVQMVKTTWTESKKKNMTSRDTEAPMGRNSACVESMV